MKLSFPIAWTVAAFLCLETVAAANERTVIAGPLSAVDIEASTIEAAGSFVRACGNVSIHSAGRRMTASDAYYNWESGSAELKNAMLTTCTNTKPDYRIEAASLTLLPGNRIRARRLAVFLGRTKVFALPRLNARIGGARASVDILPRVSYDQSSGFGIGQRFTLVDSDRASAMANVRFSEVNGFEVDLDSLVGLDGSVTSVAPEPLSYESFRTAGFTIPVRSPAAPAAPVDVPSGVARFRQFLRVSANARTYNVRDANLLIDRQPEIGVQYVAPGLRIGGHYTDDRLSDSPQVNLSWGRFREANGAGPIARTLGEVIVPYGLPLGHSRARLLAALQYRASHYGSDSNYSWLACSLGVSHMRRDGCLTAVRYINRSDSGSTPFLFDRLLVRDEIQGAVQVPFGKHLLALVAGYDTRRREVYDWSVLYGYRTDCLAAFVSWSNLESMLTFGVRLGGG